MADDVREAMRTDPGCHATCSRFRRALDAIALNDPNHEFRGKGRANLTATPASRQSDGAPPLTRWELPGGKRDTQGGWAVLVH
jgi:hypothetical protein